MASPTTGSLPTAHCPPPTSHHPLPAAAVGRAGLLLCLAALAGCARRTEIGPPTIDAGQTACAECGMAINDLRYAAAVVTSAADIDQARAAFDDIGCMLEYEKSHPDQAVIARYVMDCDSRQWIDAREAWFARSQDIPSPMAYGLAASRTQDGARKLLAGHPGDVVDFSHLAAPAPSAENGTASTK